MAVLGRSSVNTPKQAPATGAFLPAPITSVDDTGLSPLWLQDLVLKIYYFQGYMSGFKLAEEIALPFTGVLDQILEALKREKSLEVRSSQMGLGEGAYVYAITGAGIARAREALERSQYAGPAPVPLARYIESIHKQSRSHMQVTPRIIPQPHAGDASHHTPGSLSHGAFRAGLPADRTGSQFWYLHFPLRSSGKRQDHSSALGW